MSKQQKIPKLRFPGFLGEWEERELGEIADIKGGKRIPKGFQLEEEDNGNPYITVTDMRNGTVVLDKIKYVPLRVVKTINNYRIRVSDIFVSVAGTLGLVGIIPKELDNANLTENANKLTNLRCNQHFLLQYLYSDNFIKLVTNSKTTNAQPKLAIYALNSFKLHLPALPEQQKIAHFLTAIDEKINQLSRQKALLEQYKKGVMQQIFSRELRFRDGEGRAFGEWEVRRLGEVFALIITNSFSRNLLNYTDGSVKNIHYGDIHTKFKTNFDVSKEDVPFINSDVDLSRISEECYCRLGDLVIADASEDYKDIGKAIEVRNLDKYKLLAGLHTIIARDKGIKTAIGFKGYLMQSDEIRQQIMKMATGVSVLGITKNNLAQIEIPIPTLPEQQKIADFLTALDEKIARVAGQVEAVKGYKKGLLQGMFV